MKSNRRELLKTAGLALAAIPVFALTPPAAAKTNAALRAQLKYQDQPHGDQTCASCLEFIPGTAEQALGACKVIPDDDEISPHGFCTRWNTL